MLKMLTFAAMLYTSNAYAHEVWANNQPVPEWVAKKCCGPDDAHRLRKDQVKATPNGWKIEGIELLQAYGTELPSQDGEYWIFYRQAGFHQLVFCFFVPPQSY